MATKTTDVRRRTPTDDEMPGLLEALAASGGNISAFARERGLSPWKLYEARRGAGTSRARRRRRKADHEFVRVEIAHERPASSAPLELMLGSGYRLLIPATFDETALRRVMEVLASC
jgi:hypothetical protein